MRAFLVTVLFGLQSLAQTLVHRQFPNLIIPVDSRQPDKAFGTQFSADVEHAVFTEISFDAPSNAASSCKLAFFISTDPNRGAPWNLWGQAPFVFNISSLPSTMNKDTDTWNKRPQPIGWVASVELDHAGKVTITGGTVPCKKGQPNQFLLYPGSDRDFGLTWFELTDPLHGITYDMYA